RLRSVWSLRRSSQVALLGANGPLRESFTVGAVFDEVAHHPFDVIAQLVAGDLVLAQFSAEAAVQAEAAAQVHLEALDRAALAVVDHLAFEPDVGDLNSRTRIRAAVDVNCDRHVEPRVDVVEPAFEFGHQSLCPAPGFGKRQLTELDSGARHEVSAP